MNRIRPLVLVGAAVAVGLSCGDATQPDPPVPTAVNLDETALTFDALTASAQLTATVLDQNGQTMSGQAVTWSTTAPGVATVSAAGVVTAAGNGTATVRATAGNAVGQAGVTVAQAVASLEEVSGDAQTGTVATPLPQPIVVLAKDRLGNNVAGGAGGQVANLNVQFNVTSGGGVTVPTLGQIGANGQASTVWQLGNTPGANTLTAAITGGPTVDFTATGELGPPNTLAVQAGDAQTSEVGTAVPVAPSIEVTDVGGNPLENVEVAFVITQGSGGSLTGDTVMTDALGVATLGSWTLDTTAGDNTLEARADTVAVSFSATGTPGAAAVLAIFEGDGQSAVPDADVAIPPAVLVADQYNNPVSGVSVDFMVVLGGGSVTGTPATTDAMGIGRVGSWTLGSTLGTNTLDATVASVGTVTFTATAVPPTPDSVAVFEGDNQTGLVGFAVNIPPTAKVFDAAGNPFAGATVDFAVVSGGGSVTGATAVTGSDGLATVGSWTLGGSTGSNTITATVQGMNVADNPVTFTATGINSQFDIEVRFPSGATPTASQQAAFDSAEAFWERLLISEHPDLTVNLSADACGIPHPAVNETVDDLLIFAAFDSIDGTSNVLANAGFCVFRAGTDSIPAFGLMRFDTADVANLEANGQLDEVVLHEMGHVLGFGGTLFQIKGFLELSSIDNGSGADTHFDGPRARQIFDDIGGTNYTGGEKVPLHNDAVQGRADSHWRETVFDEELMTPFIESMAANPLSRVTVAAMWDLGYTVNLAASDSYSQTFTAPPPGAATAGTQLDLRGDVLLGPVYAIDREGRLVRIR